MHADEADDKNPVPGLGTGEGMMHADEMMIVRVVMVRMMPLFLKKWKGK